MKRIGLVFVGSAALLITFCGLSACNLEEKEDDTAVLETGPGGVDFVSEIKPLLEANCIACHNSKSVFGDVVLENRELAFRENKHGKVIVPGDPEASLLYQVTQVPHAADQSMPATGPKLSEEEIVLLKTWISEGAKWPEGAAGVIKPLDLDAVQQG